MHVQQNIKKALFIALNVIHYKELLLDPHKSIIIPCEDSMDKKQRRFLGDCAKFVYIEKLLTNKQ